MRLILVLLFLTSLQVQTAADDPGIKDQVNEIPGYPQPHQKVYSEYLFADAKGLRQLHYILIQSSQNSSDKPLTLWMNGGPGCSSKLGFLQQIGPYILNINQDYTDPLSVNKYAWTNQSNILFIDSPAGVGFSTNYDPDYIYNDANTADDNMKALLYFFEKKFPSYLHKKFYIAGESYAGKYIPDLALRIHSHNLQASSTVKINMMGILIGNGVMDFTDGSLEKSVVQFYFDHNFIDPTLESYWSTSCMTDPNSAGCAYFHKRCDEILYKTNPYNVYYPCYDTNALSQSNFVRELAKKSIFTQRRQFQDQEQLLGDCEYTEGVKNYFLASNHTFRPKKLEFEICNSTIFNKYKKTTSGSMYELPRVLSQTNYTVYLYNGDVDNVVPFTDTLKNLQKLTFKQSSPAKSWVIGNQNVGMKRTFAYGNKKLKFWTVKGAGHQVPQYKREVAFQLFKSFLANSD